MKKLGVLIVTLYLMLVSNGWAKNFFSAQIDGAQKVPSNYWGSYEMLTVDIDHDPYPDLVSMHSVSNGQTSTLNILTLLGAGVDPTIAFKESVINLQEISFQQLKFGHFYDAQILDLIVLYTAKDPNTNFFNQRYLMILKGNGDGTFQSQQSVYLGDDYIKAMESLDANGDGVSERVLLTRSSEILSYMIDGQGNVNLEGAFFAPLSIRSLLVKEVVGNAVYPDLILFGTSNNDSLVILEGNGDGTFSHLQTYDIESPLPSPYDVEVNLVDFNKDNLADILLMSSEGTYTYVGRKDSFEKAQGPFNTDEVEDVVVLDADHDGLLRIVAVDSPFHTFPKMFEVDASGVLIESPLSLPEDSGYARFYSGDFDLDGYDDLGIFRDDSGISILFSNTPPTLSAQSWDASTKKIRVTYTDKDNERPFVTTDAKIEVLVDGQAIAMTEVDAADTDATAATGGKVYEAKVDAAAGVHKIAFFATDGTYPATGDLTLEHDFDLTPAPSNGGGGGCTLNVSTNDAQSSASNSKSSGALFFIVMGSGLVFFVFQKTKTKIRKNN